MDNLTTLEELKKQVENQIDILEKYIENSPPYRLISRAKPKGGFYYAMKVRRDDGTVKEQYLGRDQLQLIQQLANKEYAEVCLKDKKHEKWLLEQELSFLLKEKKQDIYLKSHPGIAELLLPQLMNDDEFSANWRNAPYVKNKLYEEELVVQTIDPDVKVRSKSESLIVSCLVHNKVPFRYEEEAEFNGVTLHPDFTCLNVRSHEVFYWEHQGLYDNPQYVKKARQREDLFIKAGIVPWKNLIITTELSTQPLDVVWVECIIKHFLM